jgi:hypothetical protein
MSKDHSTTKSAGMCEISLAGQCHPLRIASVQDCGIGKCFALIIQLT